MTQLELQCPRWGLAICLSSRSARTTSIINTEDGHSLQIIPNLVYDKTFSWTKTSLCHTIGVGRPSIKREIGFSFRFGLLQIARPREVGLLGAGFNGSTSLDYSVYGSYTPWSIASLILTECAQLGLKFWYFEQHLDHGHTWASATSYGWHCSEYGVMVPKRWRDNGFAKSLISLWYKPGDGLVPVCNDSRVCSRKHEYWAALWMAVSQSWMCRPNTIFWQPTSWFNWAWI